jgi:hypothetical protein
MSILGWFVFSRFYLIQLELGRILDCHFQLTIDEPKLLFEDLNIFEVQNRKFFVIKEKSKVKVQSVEPELKIQNGFLPPPIR